MAKHSTTMIMKLAAADNEFKSFVENGNAKQYPYPIVKRTKKSINVMKVNFETLNVLSSKLFGTSPNTLKNLKYSNEVILSMV